MPHHRSDLKTFLNARQLRHTQTDAEKKLWRVLRLHQLNGIHFRRQHPVGPHIVDFCAPQIGLVIEVDGGQHAEQLEYDAERSAYLQKKGFQVLRFWNNEVMQNLDEIVRVIAEKCNRPS